MEKLNLSDIEITHGLYRNEGVVVVSVGRRTNPNSPQNLICIKKITVRSIIDANKNKKSAGTC